MSKYLPQDIEQSWYQKWEENNYFAPSGHGESYSIAIPPPNVTGNLHMGHAFQHSLVDSLIRYQRMSGNNTLWQMGTDHAGIATQMLVTEQLAGQGIKPLDIGREAFIDKVWEWKEESGGTISKQLRRLGASLHWETERFTLDDGLSEAVLEVFVRLHEEGLIYRGKRLVNWDPVLKTSISDLEVESEEEQGHLWHFRYPLAGEPGEFLVVATTRPETMLGDTAVAVSPNDDRYKALVGKEIILPLTGRRIPIIADQYVDMAFGTGCVKITPAHDFNDYDVGHRHDLPIINILNEDASLNDEVPEKYRGMDRFEARKAVIADLDALGLLEKIEDHTMAIPRGERSGVVVEPFLSDQWFVDIKSLAEPAIKAVEDGKIEFIPKNAENIYFSWMRNIEDWCISRQLWWGHRIPAWYDADGNIYVGRSEQEARDKHNLAANVELMQDPDVLDTWFSSALWTFSTLGWPEQTKELETFHSTDIMVTGHDIISLWVSRMIMMSMKFTGEVPFKKVYIHGLVTDSSGQKMSKSKGNGLDPMDIINGISLDELVAKRTDNLMQPKMAKRIDKATRKEYPEGITAYGTDPLRFTFYSIATRTRTIRFDMKRVEGYRNFCNKLWNAAIFVSGNISDNESRLDNTDVELSTIDHWIISEFQKTAAAVNLAMETYRFDLAAKEIYEFVWDEFCDWYLELTKPILNSDDATQAQKLGTQQTLARILESVLRLAHPFLPFLTEELWQKVPSTVRLSGDTIMLQPFPVADEKLISDAASKDVDWLKTVVTGVRNIRGEMDISPARQVPILFSNGSTEDQERLDKFTRELTFLVRPESLTWLGDNAEKPMSATALVGEMELLVPMAGLIDKEAELARLDKEIDRKQKDRAKTEGKINNPSFVEKAPEEVVQKERDKLKDLDSALEKLNEQRVSINEI
ncbi:MAG: valine--tRNA ligase [Gammaproteobacteria bacterium]|jgi:valyl-tRNA synthetase|nr:valine--tRNA ligase [Gammaproteobacteria bacterium]MBT5198669.1 valine--tRNA ligase [Gammaproteobacteria bacterium]MBT5792647.1 valine--tRNA ligase [Gammaproteobacteria bacterium]MBT7721835.1 valine--tRNA ligase [Gammaproteobacteria bacterium]